MPFAAGPRIVRVLESQKGWFRVYPFPLERKGEWLKVRTSQNGKAVDRWVHAQQVSARVGELIDGQARIVKGW